MQISLKMRNDACSIWRSGSIDPDGTTYQPKPRHQTAHSLKYTLWLLAAPTALQPNSRDPQLSIKLAPWSHQTFMPNTTFLCAALFLIINFNFNCCPGEVLQLDLRPYMFYYQTKLRFIGINRTIVLTYIRTCYMRTLCEDMLYEDFMWGPVI